MSGPPRIDLATELSQQLTVHKNIGQEIIVTTADKLRICLMETKDSLIAQKEWVAPLALAASLLTSIVAADFHDFVLGKATWQAAHVLALTGSTIWLVVAIVHGWRARGRGGIDHIVSRIKADTAPAHVPLVIQSATYRPIGCNDEAIDVTAALRKRVSQAGLEVVVSNALGGDPHYGIAKELVVEYTFNNERSKRVVREGDLLKLP